MDVVVVPATSTMYPTVDGPREKYIQAGRSKINEELIRKVRAIGKPIPISQCLVTDSQKLLTKDNIKKLLFLSTPSELFKESDIYRLALNFQDRVMKLQQDLE